MSVADPSVVDGCRIGRRTVPAACRDCRTSDLRNLDRDHRRYVRRWRARRDGDHQERGYGPRAVRRDRRDGRLHDSKYHRRDLHAAGVAPGLQGVRPDRSPGHGRRHRPHQRQAGGRRLDRVGDRDDGSGPAEDGQGRRQRRPQAGGRRQPAVEPVPQLSVPDEPGAGRDAAAVPERADRHPGPRADHQHQRHQPQQQRHADRRRGQHQRLAAASRRLHRAGRDHRERQHLDQQLRRGAGHDRRRGDGGA